MVRLAQLLGYLGRDGITELVLGTGRPVTVKKGGAYQPLLAAALSLAQLEELINGTALAPLVPHHDTNGAPTKVVLGGRGYVVQAARRQDAVLLKIELDPSAAHGAAEPPEERARRSAAHGAAEPPEERARRSAAHGAAEPGLASGGATRQAKSDAAMAHATTVTFRQQTAGSGSGSASGSFPASASGSFPASASGSFPASASGSAPALSSPSGSARARSEPGLTASARHDVPALARSEVAAREVVRAEPMLTPPPVGTLELQDDVDFSLSRTAAADDDESFELELDLSGEEVSAPASAAADPVRSAPAAAPPWAVAAIPAPAAPAALEAAAPRRLVTAAARAIPEAFAALIRAARQHGATDLHLSPEQPALMRARGGLHRAGEALSAAAVTALIDPWLGPAERASLGERGYADLALEVQGAHGGAGRVRANVSRVRGGLKGSFRLVWEGVPTLEALGLPRELTRVTSYHQGLVVIAGPSGHGKTTTLGALVDLINSSRPHHILCIEDPVEIVHPRKQSVVSQREVGVHTLSFASALRASLREDPDVIVIGEVRDRETVEIALTAAETGHLVIATMSTPSAAKTIDRLIDMFPPDDQQQVRVSLAAALRFIVAQRLMPRRDGQGVVPAIELLTGVLPVAALIRDNKLFQLPNLQQRGRSFGMIRFDDSLLELVRAGVVDEELALAAAESRREMQAALHPPAAAPATAAAARPWDDARQRLGGLFRRDKGGPQGTE